MSVENTDKLSKEGAEEVAREASERPEQSEERSTTFSAMKALKEAFGSDPLRDPQETSSN